MPKKIITKENAVDMLVSIHGDKYDYSLVDFVGTREPITIICSTHGEFVQQYRTHYEGRGCRKCYTDRLSLDSSEFIARAKKVHGDRYDYSKVDGVISNLSMVTIICRTHGDFEQQVRIHRGGGGCQQCDAESNRIRKLKPLDQFISDAIVAHGDKYDYSLVDYRGSKTKVAIICKTHGVFYQSPSVHTKGSNCPQCAAEWRCLSTGERCIAEILTGMGIEFIREHIFADCRLRMPLRFDFYIPSIRLLIEFDGVQHFQPEHYFGGEEYYALAIQRDSVKNKYAADNQYTLLRFTKEDLSSGAIERVIRSHCFDCGHSWRGA